MAGDGDTTGAAGTHRGDTGSRRSALVGAALALPVLAAVVVGAGAARPPATSDGVWTTPLQVVLGLVGLTLLVVMVFVLRGMEVDAVRPGPPQRRSWKRWLVLFALLLVAIVAVPRFDLAPTDIDGSPFSFGPSGSGTDVAADPLPVSPTAVVAGLTALALAVAAGLVLSGGARGPRPGRDSSRPPAPRDDAPVDPLPAGPPAQVVLAAYAAAREAVVRSLGAGEHDPPGRLLRRAAGTPMATPLDVLTRHYLPVRYGRRDATAEDAAAAVTALERLRSGATASPGGR